MDYAKTITVAEPYVDAVQKVKEAFKTQGFGVLTEIDVKATLAEKIGADVEPYVILGACNPELAHRALGISRDIGLLLPCNVVVRADGDHTIVQALDPDVFVGITARPELEPVAAEAGRRIDAALAELAA